MFDRLLRIDTERDQQRRWDWLTGCSLIAIGIAVVVLVILLIFLHELFTDPF